MKIHIIAGTYDQYRQFRNKLYNLMNHEGMDPKYTDIIYIFGPEFIRGFDNPWGYRVGTWNQRSDIEQIEQLLLQARSNINEFIEIDDRSFQ